MIAGSLGGRKLVAPPGRSTRPTSDRVREAMFSILGEVTGVRVLDLFAGSGALAIEALSRGATEATLVDSAPAAHAAIRANLDSLALDARVYQQHALSFLRRARAAAWQYDLVFLDPPYRSVSSYASRLASALEPVLSPDARAVAESDRRAPLELELPLLDERNYGDTLIRIYGTR